MSKTNKIARRNPNGKSPIVPTLLATIAEIASRKTNDPAIRALGKDEYFALLAKERENVPQAMADDPLFASTYLDQLEADAFTRIGADGKPDPRHPGNYILQDDYCKERDRLESERSRRVNEIDIKVWALAARHGIVREQITIESIRESLRRMKLIHELTIRDNAATLPDGCPALLRQRVQEAAGQAVEFGRLHPGLPSIPAAGTDALIDLERMMQWCDGAKGAVETNTNPSAPPLRPGMADSLLEELRVVQAKKDAAELGATGEPKAQEPSRATPHYEYAADMGQGTWTTEPLTRAQIAKRIREPYARNIETKLNAKNLHSTGRQTWYVRLDTIGELRRSQIENRKKQKTRT